MCDVPEGDFIKESIDAVKEALHFFSNKCKPDREKWVVREFLFQLDIVFEKEDVFESRNEPADVDYCDARFQVKEIYDEGRRRCDEYKESLRKAESATSASDLLEPYSYKKIACDEIASRVASWALSLSQKKYGPSECRSTDLLFYFNLEGTHVAGDVLTNTNIETLSSKMVAWRSVSVFAGDCAFVLHTSEQAPDFLKTAKGKIYRKPPICFVD